MKTSVVCKLAVVIAPNDTDAQVQLAQVQLV
jgi:hypothetical protein